MSTTSALTLQKPHSIELPVRVPRMLWRHSSKLVWIMKLDSKIVRNLKFLIKALQGNRQTVLCVAFAFASTSIEPLLTFYSILPNHPDIL